MKTKLIDSGVSSKHAPHWTIAEAIREVVQNWIDVTEEFQVKGSISWKRGIALVKDAGPGIHMRHLAFGQSEKSAGSIGQFGEGLKSAFIVLVRNGRTISLKSNGLEIIPRLLDSQNFETETLHFEISPLTPRLAACLKGTHIRVECTQPELDEAKGYFTRLAVRAQNDFEWLEKDRLSLPGGRVYVAGSVVGHVEDALFSYHFDGSGAAREMVNRDRNTVNMNVLQALASKTLLATSSEKVMEILVVQVTLDDRGWETTLNYYGSDKLRNKNNWKRTWNKIVGKETVIEDSLQATQELRYRGFSTVQVGWRMQVLWTGIGVLTGTKALEKMASKSFSQRPLKLDALTPEERYVYHQIMDATKTYYSDPGKVFVVESLSKFAANGSDPEGMYDPGKDTTYLNRKVLSDFRLALEVLLHETVHKVSGASDLTAEFERALLNVAVQIILPRVGSKLL